MFCRQLVCQQVFGNSLRGSLACAHGANDGLGSGDGVAACENAGTGALAGLGICDDEALLFGELHAIQTVICAVVADGLDNEVGGQYKIGIRYGDGSF